MKKFLPLIFSALFCLPIIAEESFRTWNDQFGRSFEAEIVSVSPGFVRLRNRLGKEVNYQIAHLTPADQTVALAWKPDQAPTATTSEFVKAFEGDLVILNGKKVEDLKKPDLSKVKYFAFYKSASWCGPCRKFTPDLVKFYNRIKPDHPEFELIFVSHDQSKDSMKKYMIDDKMPWPAFEFGKHKSVVTSYGNGIPCLIVTDADGKKLYDSYTKANQYRGPISVMDELEKLLK
jgi:nucleoredoxin